MSNKTALESKLSKLAGEQVEITVRGATSFTLSFDVVNKSATAKLIDFFKGHTVSVDEDAECGTCIYLEAQ
jgi:hypothetical protein